MRFLFIFIILNSLLSIGLHGQNKIFISGEIKDEKDNPISQALIAIEGTAVGTYSNDNGAYTLELLPDKYKIVISSVGYKTLKAEITIQANKKQDFVLEENKVTLEGVTVYGKSRVQQIRESSFAVNVLQIGESLQNSSANLNNIVGRTSSVRIREEGGTGSDFDLSINGLSGNSVRYFIDGVPLSSLGSGVSLSNVPTNIIEQVEIYKGVVPAHLGADALGGAINIITKKNQRNYLDASYGIGSFHTHKADLNAQFIESKTGLIIRPTISLNYSKNDYTMKGVEVWDEDCRKYILVDRKRFHDDYSSLFGQFEVGFANKTWADALFISCSYSEINKELQTGSVQSKVYGMAKKESNAWNISARYQKRDFIIENLQLNASLSQTWDRSLTVDTAYRQYDWNGDYIETPRNEITGRGRSMRHYKRPAAIVRTNFDYWLNERHSFNANYLLNRLNNERYDDVDADFEASNDVMAKHILGLSYGQSLLKRRMSNTFFIKEYINHLNIRQTDIPSVTGSKEVTGSITQNFFGYGISTRFTIVDPLAIKASYEHSVRLPLARELLGNGTTVYANVALKPESSNNINMGIFGTWRPASGHTFYYEANGFLRYADNYIQAAVSEKEGTLQYENVPSVHIKGIEGEVHYNWQNKLQLSTNISYQDARDQGKYKTDGKISATYKNRVPNQPWVFGNVEASYAWRNVVLPESKLRLGCTYQWVHWYFLTWEAYGARESKARIPTQYIYNTNITYSWKHGRYNIALECANIFDETAYDNYKLQKPGRSFFAKFRLFLN
ncbi:MAG: TonB-dependent receptor [Massilibacteroides sp.]|nr:TonB-dependent receptor [Massilibacteroides sp.]MDD3062513.1 TonB-dependent receptor [Massilibacteroides sp.]MDD4114448.1 TonB-dependent receptor [Massilibacteroides sp.]MDD4660341.1 TonB-dependent receptor [Massilibacteroides sp.]